MVRQTANIEMESLGDPKKVISVVFSSQELKEKMTLQQGILYYIESNAIGIIDYENALWYAQIFSAESNETLARAEFHEYVSKQLDKTAGFSFNKKIEHAGFWTMHPRNAKHYRNNRLFLVGDAAHTLPPTGGLGLNTALGDVVNLMWKDRSI